jgi:hypothetical protein
VFIVQYSSMQSSERAVSKLEYLASFGCVLLTAMSLHFINFTTQPTPAPDRVTHAVQYSPWLRWWWAALMFAYSLAIVVSGASMQALVTQMLTKRGEVTVTGADGGDSGGGSSVQPYGDGFAKWATVNFAARSTCACLLCLKVLEGMHLGRAGVRRAFRAQPRWFAARAVLLLVSAALLLLLPSLGMRAMHVIAVCTLAVLTQAVVCCFDLEELTHAVTTARTSLRVVSQTVKKQARRISTLGASGKGIDDGGLTVSPSSAVSDMA